MFTKKHYKQIVEVLAESDTKDDVIEGLCRVFKEDNERFDKDKFQDAYYKAKRTKRDMQLRRGGLK